MSLDHALNHRLGQRRSARSVGAVECTEATKPENAAEGLVIYCTDSGATYVYDQDAWVPMGGGGNATGFMNDVSTFAAGQTTMVLSHTPLSNSEHVYWEGIYQPGSEWTRSGKTITFLDTTGMTAGDKIHVEYAYPLAEVGITNLQSWLGIESMSWPAGSQPGDLVLIFVGQATNDGFSAMNGWTEITITPWVSHMANTEVWSARLVVLAKIKPTGTTGAATEFPTRVDGYGQSVFVVVSMTGPTGVTATELRTTTNATSVTAPALSGSQFKAWICVADDPNVQPASGTVLQNLGPINRQDIDIVVTHDESGAAVSAPAGVEGSWAYGTIRVG